MTTELLIAAPLLCVLAVMSGTVSASETALFGLTHAGRARLRQSHPGQFAAFTAVMERPRVFLVALLACNMVVNVSYFAISSVVTVRFEDEDRHLAAAVFAVVTLAVLVTVGEIAAKLTASAAPQTVCRLAAPLWLMVLRVGWPVWSGLDRGVIGPLIRLVPPSPRPVDGAPSSRDIATILSERADGADEADAVGVAERQRMLLAILRLRERRAREVMRPRVECPLVRLDAAGDRVSALVAEHDSLLVTDPKTDDPIGWLNAARHGYAGFPVAPADRRRLLEPVVFVPGQATLDAVLERLRETGAAAAAVVDEFGETTGVLTLDALVGLLVGDAPDPVPDSIEQPRLVAMGVFAVPGRWPVRALFKDLRLPDHTAQPLLARVSTVGGLVAALLGRVPVRGDSVTIPGAEIAVTELEGRYVAWTEVRFTDAHPKDGAGGGK